MNKKNINEIAINPRNLNHNKNSILNANNDVQAFNDKERFEFLKNKLKDNVKEDIYNKIEAMYILMEIKNKAYYKLDGYKSFEKFIKDYRLARSQAYTYLKIAGAIKEGVLKQEYLVENGFRQSMLFLINHENEVGKLPNQSSKKFLRLQLKNQESYFFYKKNYKFTEFFLDKVFLDKKDWIEQIMKEFKEKI
ncbi:chromosome replication/partitioning protein [Borreliella valaisiana]|uniref:Putative plasmid partition protein n=1 Tax=Borreliella valaisiana VS116 TaxID=445987 RepID=C0R9H9_BORVA|nr:chromosome replication/partitioning protein [Borreliella valaisiana]ACN53113.1 putative plasmid partition protein [Borreliella valaisiana VS116]